MFLALVMVTVFCLACLASPGVIALSEDTGRDLGDLSSSQNPSSLKEEIRIAVYGTSITAMSFPAHMGRVLGRGELPHLGFPGYGTTREMLWAEAGSVEIFKEDPFDIIIISWGIRDLVWGVPWNETRSNARLIFRALKETGASVVFYNQVTYHHGDYERICEKEGVLFVRNATYFFGDPYLKADPIHPNDEGYGIMAELVARAMTEVGLVEGAELCPGEARDLVEVFSEASRRIDEAEERGLPRSCLEELRSNYAMAEYIGERGHCYTARWELEEKVIAVLDPVLEHFDEMSSMLIHASEIVEEAEAKGMDDRMIQMVEGWYHSAQLRWNKCEYGNTMNYLQQILDKEPEIQAFPEPTLLPAISILMLPVFMWRTEHSSRKESKND